MIPAIDLESFASAGPPGRAAVAAAVDDACRTVGFFTIVGHGVESPVVAGAWEAGRRFFALPLAEKMTVAMPAPGYPYGYSPVAGEALSYSLGIGGLPDLKESYVIGPIAAPPVDRGLIFRAGPGPRPVSTGSAAHPMRPR
jgi:isopenicillin N synthase-like dioxygenase